MSESSTARWNVTQMTPQAESILSVKRKRQEDDVVEGEEYYDFSRSSSPANEAMDVDHEDTVSKYDEFISKPILEPVTVDTKIKPSNKGFALLAKMGWSEGHSLGLSGDGCVDPISFEIKQDTLGIGRATQEGTMAVEAVSTRRTLDSERQIQETEDQRRAREDAVARRAAVQDEITNTLRAFYCSLCDKQFQTVAQFDEHTNSYAHHHKARFKDMQANARIKPQEEIDKRKEKERKREERELRKIAAAAGIKMSKGLQMDSTPAVLAPTAAASDGTSTMDVELDSSQKKGGWPSTDSISTPSASAPAPAPAPAFKKSGWTTVGSSFSGQLPPSPQSNSSSGRAPVLATTPLSSSVITSKSSLSSLHHAPSFRTGGWTSLDTGTMTTDQFSRLETISAAAAIPITPMTNLDPVSLPPSSDFSPPQSLIGGTRGGWSSISSKMTTPTSTPLPLGSPPGPRSPLQSPDNSGAVISTQFTSSNSHVVPISAPSQTLTTTTKSSTSSTELERSGWQKFQAKNPSKNLNRK